MKNSSLSHALNLTQSDRVAFIPAIYEHKAWFINQTPSRVCRDPNLLFKALLAEYETLLSDVLTIGIDIYNIEAEALGCAVTYYDNDTSIPAISAGGHLQFHGVDHFVKMPVPNPSISGRMALNINTARRLVRELGSEIPVRGAVSGPFSLASALFGAEQMFILSASQPHAMKTVLQKCANVIVEYGRAFIDVGCDVVVFDSQATPELISPTMYRTLVMPFHKQIVDKLKITGSGHVPIIIGGNTTPILDDYLSTGANNILCDGKSDHRLFLEKCKKISRSFRRNIPTSDFLTLQPEKLYTIASGLIDEATDYAGFILGTGVIPYGTPTENILAIKRAAYDHGKID
jgi:uroporphyrinogen decarboxylase